MDGDTFITCKRDKIDGMRQKKVSDFKLLALEKSLTVYHGLSTAEENGREWFASLQMEKWRNYEDYEQKNHSKGSFPNILLTQASLRTRRDS